jgi:hypothetical protein
MVKVEKLLVLKNHEEVTSINSTDSVDSYCLKIYCSTNYDTGCKLTITIGGNVALITYTYLYAGYNELVCISFRAFARGTIADLMAKYGVTENQLTICVEAEPSPVTL